MMWWILTYCFFSGLISLGFVVDDDVFKHEKFGTASASFFLGWLLFPVIIGSILYKIDRKLMK